MKRPLVIAIAVLAASNLAGLLVPRMGIDQARRDFRELSAKIDEGSVRDDERLAYALHVLASHGRVFPPDFVERLLASPDPMLVDYAMTHDFARGDAVDVQKRWRDEHPERVAPAFFFEHQARTVQRAELRAYLAADDSR